MVRRPVLVSDGIGRSRFVKILVPVKRVVDYNIRVRAKSDESGVDLANLKMSMNPFDEIAVEEAVRLKEAGFASEIVAVSAGAGLCQETLRTAMAIGADRAILIETAEKLQPLAVAKLLKAVCDHEQPRIVICGKQAIDDDANQTGQMLAALLDWPQAPCASRITVTGERLSVVCEIDGGQETVEMDLPAVITADLRLNEPRYSTLPNIMKAKKKPVAVTTPEALGVEVAPHLRSLKTTEPVRRAPGRKLSSITELVVCLRNEGVV